MAVAALVTAVTKSSPSTEATTSSEIGRLLKYGTKTPLG